MLHDERQMRARVIKAARRRLIDVLKMAYPTPLGFEGLLHTMPTLESAHLRVDLEYLLGKGYLKEIDPRANKSWKDRSFSLSPPGVEIADAINVDPALEV